jgi:hypothetical protein
MRNAGAISGSPKSRSITPKSFNTLSIDSYFQDELTSLQSGSSSTVSRTRSISGNFLYVESDGDGDDSLPNSPRCNSSTVFLPTVRSCDDFGKDGNYNNSLFNRNITNPSPLTENLISDLDRFSLFSPRSASANDISSSSSSSSSQSFGWKSINNDLSTEMNIFDHGSSTNHNNSNGNGNGNGGRHHRHIRHRSLSSSLQHEPIQEADDEFESDSGKEGSKSSSSKSNKSNDDGKLLKRATSGSVENKVIPTMMVISSLTDDDEKKDSIRPPSNTASRFTFNVDSSFMTVEKPPKKPSPIGAFVEEEASASSVSSIEMTISPIIDYSKQPSNTNNISSAFTLTHPKRNLHSSFDNVATIPKDRKKCEGTPVLSMSSSSSTSVTKKIDHFITPQGKSVCMTKWIDSKVAEPLSIQHLKEKLIQRTKEITTRRAITPSLAIGTIPEEDDQEDHFLEKKTTIGGQGSGLLSSSSVSLFDVSLIPDVSTIRMKRAHSEQLPLPSFYSSSVSSFPFNPHNQHRDTESISGNPFAVGRCSSTPLFFAAASNASNNHDNSGLFFRRDEIDGIQSGREPLRGNGEDSQESSPLLSYRANNNRTFLQKNEFSFITDDLVSHPLRSQPRQSTSSSSSSSSIQQQQNLNSIRRSYSSTSLLQRSMTMPTFAFPPKVDMRGFPQNHLYNDEKPSPSSVNLCLSIDEDSPDARVNDNNKDTTQKDHDDLLVSSSSSASCDT